MKILRQVHVICAYHHQVKATIDGITLIAICYNHYPMFNSNISQNVHTLPRKDEQTINVSELYFFQPGSFQFAAS